jgi:HSP20 family molecular chaperone IbpA
MLDTRAGIDVVDEGKVLRVTAELPGMARADLNVSVEDGAIVLRGEKKQDVRSEENGCYRLERAHGTFVRMIPMPEYATPTRPGKVRQRRAHLDGAEIRADASREPHD